jgi:hypothetical protein
VHTRAGHAQQAVAVGQRADEVDHRRVAAAGHRAAAERQAEHRAHVVLELRGHGALDRPVAGVVHARRHLVGDQRAADVEQFDREYADVVEFTQQGPHELLGRARHGRCQIGRRCSAAAQDAALVHVLGEWPDGRLAVDAAHREHRQLARERDQTLDDQAAVVAAREFGERACDVVVEVCTR